MKTFISAITLWIGIVVLFIPSAKAQQTFDAVAQNIRQRVASDYNQAVSVAYIYPDGDTQYFNVGAISAEGNAPVTQNTIYEIGSISKTFTSLILARMVQEGMVSLQTTIGEILPDTLDLPIYEGKKITLLNLATHTSALPRLPENMSPEDPLNPYADYTVQQMYAFLDGYELTRAPGGEVVYSNLGAGLLGHLLALKSGMDYEHLLHHYITEPLQMEDTDINVPSRKQDRFAAPYNFGREVKRWDLPALAGAGAIRSMAADMVIYMKAQMDFIETKFDSAITLTHKIQFEGTTDLTSAVGLGWFYATKHDTIIWHNGGTGGYHSFAGWNIENQTGVVVLASGADVTDIGLHMLDPRHQLKEIQKTAEVDSATIAAYVGTYKTKTPPGLTFYVIQQGDELWVEISGQTRQRVFPSSQTRFFYRSVDAEIEFQTDTAGSVSGLTLFQNGRAVNANKRSNEIERPVHEAIDIDPAILDRYTGTYQITPAINLTVTKEGDQLMVQLTGQPKFPVFPETKTKFFLKVVEAQVEFIANEKGAFTKVKLYQMGRVLTGQRVE